MTPKQIKKAAYDKEYRKRNRTKLLSQMREYRNSHKEELKEYHKKRHKENYIPTGGSGGFDRSKPAIFYVIRLDGLGLIKAGVTNRSIEDRYRDEKVAYTVLQSVTFSFGEDALVAEEAFIRENEPKKVSPDFPSPFVYTKTKELFYE